MALYTQVTIDDFVEVESPKKLICCSLAKGFHWLRISKGHTPEEYRENIDFVLDDQEYLYIGTEVKDGVIESFDGMVIYKDWDESQEGDYA